MYKMAKPYGTTLKICSDCQEIYSGLLHSRCPYCYPDEILMIKGEYQTSLRQYKVELKENDKKGDENGL